MSNKTKEARRQSKFVIRFAILIIAFMGLSSFLAKPDWGFFGHRKINRMAVFTLPPELIKFYKRNIEYITEHAVDPDKRRYATKHEAVRHYIDIDSWGDNPFFDVPRIFDDALFKYAKYHFVDGTDTTSLNLTYSRDSVTVNYLDRQYYTPTDTFRQFFRRHIRPQYYDNDVWSAESIKIDSVFAGISNGATLIIEDDFSKEGILPYHMISMYYRLVQAFKDNDHEKILRLSAEYGHYIGDAHVPLHTTKNYNGQLTDQVGIHAFWESRLPELFADREYSYLVGKALYIKKPNPYFWNIVKASHDLLPEVLEFEKELTESYPDDQQMCFDERLERTIKTQCPEFARAYHDRLNGMVEQRMQDAILSIGSVWYSAWIDAGQPDLESNARIIIEEPEIKFDPSISTRQHGG